uniref:NTR domain-containing protein n=1 Tax=Ciona savignyi TaxID=51511 RepID=H2ZNR2_CIOSA
QKVRLTITVSNSNSDFTEHIEILVSKESGYIQVITDRPVYKPRQTVHIQAYLIDQKMRKQRNVDAEIIVKTPDGVGVAKNTYSNPDGSYFEHTFNIHENPIYGIWSIEVRYSSEGFTTSSNTTFKIDRYVLPTFHVSIDMDKSFILTSDQHIRGTIRAQYSYGEPVDGSFYLSVKLRKAPETPEIEFYKIPSRITRTALFRGGTRSIAINRAKLTNLLQGDETLTSLAGSGATVSITATVSGQADGVMESAIIQNIPIIKTPYKIADSRVLQFYTPRISYILQVDIQDILSGQNIRNVPVVIEISKCYYIRNSNSGNDGQINFPYNFNGVGTQRIRVTTANPDLEDENQASINITIRPYHSPGNRFLTVKPNRHNIGVGQNFFVTFAFNSPTPTEIRYYVVARGSIVASGKNTPLANAHDSTQIIDITHKMVPSARVVAYYLHGAEVVSNSVWIDVIDECKDELSVEVPEQVQPGGSVQYTVTGGGGATVSLSGVDRAAYFLYNQSRVTRQTMFNEMEEYDQGCVRNGGRNGQNVFFGAGLSITTNTLKPSSVDNLLCNSQASSRKKRQAEPTVVISVEDKFLQCAENGKKINTEVSCMTRYKQTKENYDDVYPGCSELFLQACETAVEAQSSRRGRMLGRALANQNNLQRSVDAAVRKDFKESLIFSINTMVFTLLSYYTIVFLQCSKMFINKFCSFYRPQDGTLQFQEPATDSITTYEIDAMAMKDTEGAFTNFMCLHRNYVFTQKTHLRQVGNINNNTNHALKVLLHLSHCLFHILYILTDGFCIAPTAHLKVFKDVFIQVYTPYSLKKREQSIIKFSVFNYKPNELITVQVLMKPDPTLCTHFKSGAFSSIMNHLGVGPRSTGSASFTVLPLTVPNTDSRTATVELMIRDRNNRTLDHIKKEILIEDEGEIKDIYETFPVDLKNDRRQDISFSFRFPEEFVQGTRECKLFAYMDFMGAAIEVDPITKEPNNVASLIRQPHGCGEQTMIYAGPTVFALMYLTTSGKIATGSQQYNAAVAKIEAAFQRELTYRSHQVNPRIWSVFTHYLPSTWLNAFVDKVFYHGKRFDTDMSVTPICQSLNYLMSQQRGDGHFHESQRPLHREMHGAVSGPLTLTAYVAITMGEIESLCLPNVNMAVDQSRSRAISYLEANKNHATFQRPYPLSLLAYAAALHNPQSSFAREMYARLLSKKQTAQNNQLAFWRAKTLAEVAGTGAHAYWYRTRPLALDIEATSYALLTHVIMIRNKNPLVQGDLDLARKIALWLIGQRNEGGGFRSTQDTVVGLQALSTYLAWSSTVDPGIPNPRIDFEIHGAAGTQWNQTHPRTEFIDNNNQGLKKAIPVVPDSVQFKNSNCKCSGQGEGVLSYRCTYRTVVDEESCHFHLNHTVRVMNPEEPLQPKRIKLTVISKLVGPQADASIVDIGLMSGFSAITATLDDISMPNVVDGVVDRYEETNQNVVLYLHKITNETTTLSFEMRQNVRVEKPQPAKINVYDYYEPAVHCGQFYSLPDVAHDLQTSNCGSGNNANDAVCECAEGGCPTCRTRNASLFKTTCLLHPEGDLCRTCDERNPESCINQHTVGCRASYVYKIRVQNVEVQSVFLKITAEVTDILRSSRERPLGEVRTFSIRNDCYENCRDRDEDEQFEFLQHLSMIIFVFNYLFCNNKIEFNKHLYRVDDEVTIERLIEDDKCARAKTVVRRLQCNSPAAVAGFNQRKRNKCNKNKKMDVACENIKRLKITLANGCD